MERTPEESPNTEKKIEKRINRKKFLTRKLSEEMKKFFFYFHHRAIPHDWDQYGDLSAHWLPQEPLWDGNSKISHLW